jgi:glycyl-tRNA synthetase alpha subunit
VVIALCAALLGSHRLVIDNVHDEIRDVYLAAPVQSLALDPAHEGGLSIDASWLDFRIGQTGSGWTLWCFSPGDLGLDPAGLDILRH